uniref:ASC-1 like domain protein n=1 Tax=Pithovirus LCPAC202 TaxID=2506592 RepID=A0A481Z5X8_9VIRU|nr:MAG: ASC-1 like domain protein [Pithovirus LCPAC202]
MKILFLLKKTFEMDQSEEKPATYRISIQNPKECPTFDYIKQGIKTVEGRKNSEKYQKIKIDDIILFECNNETIKTRVTYVHKYLTLKDYLKKETLELTLPNVGTVRNGITIYNNWSTQKERDKLRKKYGFGFLGIGIRIE